MARKRQQPNSPVDELYAVPLTDFTQKRNALAAQLRKEGHGDEAEAIKALAKPNVAAWVINQLVRRQARLLDEFMKSAAGLREAQVAGRGDVQAGTRAERQALRRLVEAAAEELGGKASAEVLSRVRQTFEAAAVDEDAAERVRQGRLARELEPGGFGSLASHAPSRTAKPARPTAPSRDETLERRAREALRDAEQRLEQAAVRRDQTRAALRDADRDVAAATAARAQARSALDRAERELAAAVARVEHA